MSNLCSSSVTFYSTDQKMIKSMQDRFVKICADAMTAGGSHSDCPVGYFLDAFFPGSEKIANQYRGTVTINETDVSVDGYYAFSIIFISFRRIAMGLWRQIAKRFYPGVSMAYIAEDSALECYLKWDPRDLFYHERYALDGYIPVKPHGAMYIEGEEKFWTGGIEEVLCWLDEKLPFTYEHSSDVCDVEKSIQEKLEELEDERGDDEDEEKEDQYFFTFTEYISFAPEEFEFKEE